MTVICKVDPATLRCKVCRRPARTPSLVRACVRTVKPVSIREALPCVYRQAPLRSEPCELCGRKGELEPIYGCDVFGECSIRKYKTGGKVASCLSCDRRATEKPKMKPKNLTWAYGVTTIKQRFTDYLPRTLGSLASAGFPEPWLFIDGPCTVPEAFAGYSHTIRNPRIRAAGNWMLAALELSIRYPDADCYAIFQDDIVVCTNLRRYLDSCDWEDYPERGYFNLITYPQNVKLNEERKQGWYKSNQHGLGAQGLVFSNNALRTLLSQRKWNDRPRDAHRGYRAIDGGIVDSMKAAGWTEYVHEPSLIGHIGLLSAIGNKPQPEITSFRGETFDALSSCS